MESLNGGWEKELWREGKKSKGRPLEALALPQPPLPPTLWRKRQQGKEEILVRSTEQERSWR